MERKHSISRSKKQDLLYARLGNLAAQTKSEIRNLGVILTSVLKHI